MGRHDGRNFLFLIGQYMVLVRVKGNVGQELIFLDSATGDKHS